MKLMFWRRRGPLDCAQVGKLLQQYLDGELHDGRDDGIHEHLEQCLRCGLEADAYERLKASLATRGRVEVDDPSLERLRSFADGRIRGETDR